MQNRIKKILETTIFLLLFSNVCLAQELTSKQRSTIDSLTTHWSNKETPGGAIAIIYKEKLLVQKTQGLSNKEKRQEINPNTSFQLAQLSDSFIAYAILQLHYAGKLSLDDSVTKYIPELKNACSVLKVKHLLQQSSGVHDFEILKNISGWSDDKAFSMADAITILSSQASLSFTPGTDFSYSRSNMLLAAEIVSKAAKMPFSDYMNSHIFKPLGMNNSFVLSKDNQLKNILAKSYRSDDQGTLSLIPSKKETYASINIVSSIKDMVKWEMNLMKPAPKTGNTVKHFNGFVVLDNGESYSVPRGKLTYGQKYIHKERGIATAMSTGGIDGFASAIFNFPTENFTVITLSNNGEPYNGYIGMLSAHAILTNSFTEPTSTDFKALKTVPLDYNYHKKYEGLYWDALGELSREIRIENDTLRYIRPNGNRTSLIPLSKDSFQMQTNFDDKIYLNFKALKDKTEMTYEFGEATPIPFVKYDKIDLKNEVLENTYAGTYFCEALDISCTFKAENGKLILNTGNSKSTFVPITENVFLGDQWYMQSIDFRSDVFGKTVGFFVRNDAIRNLWFEKKEKS